jgi:hypothetical protein
MSKYVIKVHETYVCDSAQGIQYLFEIDRAIKYDTKEFAEIAAKAVVKCYPYTIELLDQAIKMALEDEEEFKQWHQRLLLAAASSGKYGMDHPIGSALMRDIFRDKKVKGALKDAWQRIVVDQGESDDN